MEIPGKRLCFVAMRATEKQYVEPEDSVVSLTRLRLLLVDREVKEFLLSVKDANRG